MGREGQMTLPSATCQWFPRIRTCSSSATSKHRLISTNSHLSISTKQSRAWETSRTFNSKFSRWEDKTRRTSRWLSRLARWRMRARTWTREWTTSDRQLSKELSNCTRLAINLTKSKCKLTREARMQSSSNTTWTRGLNKCSSWLSSRSSWSEEMSKSILRGWS